MKLLTKSLLALAICSSSYVAAEVSVTGTLTSDYVFRGVSQSDEGPAAQISVDYANENGFFVGVWASNVDFGDDADVEIDYYLGYAADKWDVSYVYYTYQDDIDADYGEIILNGYFGAFTGTLGYAPDYANTDESVTYVSGAYDIELANDYGLTLQAGYSIGDDALGDDYLDYSATIAKTFNGFDVSAAVISTDMDDVDVADTRFVVSVSRTF